MDVEHTTENLPSDQRELTRRAARASGAGEMPRTIFRYVLETSGLHQLFLLLLTVGVFLLEVVPLELQRRVVNDLVKHGDFWLVIVLCAVYAGTVLVQGGAKLVLNVYRSWVGERATRDLRRRVRVLASSPSSASSGSEAQGIQASMIVAEVEPIGGFVGASVSEPLLQGGVLLSVLAYMIHVDLWMAGSALALFVPQLVFVPLMQGAVNRRTGVRVQIIRQRQRQRRRGDQWRRRAGRDRRRAHRPRVRAQHGNLSVQVLDELPDEPEHSIPDHRRAAGRRMVGAYRSARDRRCRGLHLGNRPIH
jgi:ABC-type multidrug transport system fused ATPase/permease subunit